MRDRLEEVREKMEEERRGRESLRTRFAQTHEDVAYTILALLPTLSAQVLRDMDVDVLTQELQTRSRARSARVHLAPVASRPPSSLASSITSSVNEAELERSRSPAASAVSSTDGNGYGRISETSSAAGDGEAMSESMISTTTNTTNTTTNSESESGDTRTKAELWNEVKILTFTRTLTTLYSSTLLCLLTTLQLTLLARGKYVNAVLQLEKQERLEERMRDRMERELSPANLLLKGIGGWVEGVMGRGGGAQAGLEDLFQGLGMDGDFDLTEDDVDESPARGGQTFGGGKVDYPHVWLGEISEEMESKYLTMSWWLLHVGWKDVGERVRRAVEEVFNGVSLKTKLAAIDLHRLIVDVRRRVEHEITFEGNEKKTNFLSSLLPPTPETIHHVLTQGGYKSSSTSVSAQSNNGTLIQPTFSDEYYHPRHHHHRHDEHDHHERKPTGSSTSLESSQISYNFVNSPALAVSAHVPGQASGVIVVTGEEHLRLSHHPHARYPHHSHPHPHEHPTSDPAQVPPVSYVPPPPPTQYALLDEPFLSLIEETRTILASPDFARVLEVCLDRATEVLFEGLEKNVFGRNGDDFGQGVERAEEERVRLAGLLPGLARWSQLALDGLPNELVDKILNMREVSCLSAITFARFEERFQ
ncbi:Peroxin-3-domain-containing protein [Flammula alnicola]|nr:Peroxin-3-domain-containing protein [Flammula alnicola]